MSYRGVVLMKKTISILITIALLFSITACTKEPESYVADDFSYLMFDGVKYERVEMPFYINILGTLNGGWNYGNVYFQSIAFVQDYLYHYAAAKRDPLVWWSDNYYRLYDVTFANEKTLKWVESSGQQHIYALPQDKVLIEQELQNTFFPSNNAFIDYEVSDNNKNQHIKISEELANYIVQKQSELCNYVESNPDGTNRMFFNNECVDENVFVFVYDNYGNLKKALFQLVIVNGRVLLFDPRIMSMDTYKELPKVADHFTPISEIEYLFLPEEFNEELAPVIEEIMRIREERLSNN